jgi:hypothetical protein
MNEHRASAIAGRNAEGNGTRHAPAAALHALRLPLFTMAVACLGAMGGCAGYQIGNDTLYPTNIHTVYVPIFQSDSFRPGLGEQLTEAVQKEIEKKTSYKVVGTPNADSVLSGKITGNVKHVLVRDIYNDPRELQVNLQVKVQWIDRQQNVIRNMNPLPVPADMVTISETGSLIPEVGQSMATAQQQAIKRIAQQIVGMMENPW